MISPYIRYKIDQENGVFILSRKTLLGWKPVSYNSDISTGSTFWHDAFEAANEIESKRGTGKIPIVKVGKNVNAPSL